MMEETRTWVCARASSWCVGWRLALAVALTLVALPRAAWAIGSCENEATKYALTDVNPEGGLLAFTVRIDVCETLEGPVEDEKWEVMQGMLVTDLSLRNRRWFLSPKGKAQLERVPAGAAHRRPLAEWPDFRRQHGLRPADVVALYTGTEPCTVETVALVKDKGKGKDDKAEPLSQVHGKNSFSTFRIALRLHLGGNQQEMIELGRHAVSAGAPGVWALLVNQGLRVYTVTAKCDGGPPPGMFDDDGDCYAGWYLGYKELTLKKAPGLQLCMLSWPAQAPGAGGAPAAVGK